MWFILIAICTKQAGNTHEKGVIGTPIAHNQALGFRHLIGYGSLRRCKYWRSWEKRRTRVRYLGYRDIMISFWRCYIEVLCMCAYTIHVYIYTQRNIFGCFRLSGVACWAPALRHSFRTSHEKPWRAQKAVDWIPIYIHIYIFTYPSLYTYIYTAEYIMCT